MYSRRKRQRNWFIAQDITISVAIIYVIVLLSLTLLCDFKPIDNSIDNSMTTTQNVYPINHITESNINIKYVVQLVDKTGDTESEITSIHEDNIIKHEELKKTDLEEENPETDLYEQLDEHVEESSEEEVVGEAESKKEAEAESEERAESEEELESQENVESTEEPEYLSDEYLLAYAMAREAADFTDAWYVGAVILNRVEDPDFPNTVIEVLEQEGQYPWGDSSYSRERIYDEEFFEIAEELLNGERPLPSNVVFQAQFKQGSGTYCKYGVHYYCYK